MEYVHGLVDQVHMAGSWVHDIFKRVGRFYAVHSKMGVSDKNVKGYALPSVENKMDGQDLMNPRSDQGRSTRDKRLRLKPMNRYAPLNRGHRSRDGRSSGILLRLTAPARTGARKRHGQS
jgi:hypothetical protein